MLSSTCLYSIKIRRKEKDSTPYVVADVNDNGRSYLDDELTQECIVDVDLSAMVFRPIGVEYNEWLATHSELLITQSSPSRPHYASDCPSVRLSRANR